MPVWGRKTTVSWGLGSGGAVMMPVSTVLVSSVTLPAVMVPVRGGVLIPLTVTVSVFVAVPP